MEVVTMTPEGAEFMRDILAGNEESIADYIKSVDTKIVCANIYKLAQYANDLGVQIENTVDPERIKSDAEWEIKKIESKYSMYDYYKDEYRKLKTESQKLKEIIKVMAELTTSN